MKYIRKSEPVEAIRWFKIGDHPDVELYKSSFPGDEGSGQLPNGRIIRPGDWIVDDQYPCSDKDFVKNYEQAKWSISFGSDEIVDTIRKIIDLLNSLIERD